MVFPSLPESTGLLREMAPGVEQVSKDPGFLAVTWTMTSILPKVEAIVQTTSASPRRPDVLFGNVSVFHITQSLTVLAQPSLVLTSSDDQREGGGVELKRLSFVEGTEKAAIFISFKTLLGTDHSIMEH